MQQPLDTRTKLLTKSPFPLMIELAIPAVLGMVVVGLYNMMDSIFVGQMVGDVQMGAVSVSYPFTLINAGSAAMIGVGSASVLSRAIGKKDQDTVKKIMGNLVAVVLLMSVVYMAIGMVFTRQLLSLAGASDNISAVLELFVCAVVGHQSGISARRRYKLWCKGLRPGEEADRRIYHCRHGSVSAVLYPGRVVPGQSAFHVHYNAGGSSFGSN